MDEEEEEVPPKKIKGEMMGDPNEPTKTEGAVQVNPSHATEDKEDEEMEDMETPKKSEVQDFKDDSSEPSSQGQGCIIVSGVMEKLPILEGGSNNRRDSPYF